MAQCIRNGQAWLNGLRIDAKPICGWFGNDSTSTSWGRGRFGIKAKFCEFNFTVDSASIRGQFGGIGVDLGRDRFRRQFQDGFASEPGSIRNRFGVNSKLLRGRFQNNSALLWPLTTFGLDSLVAMTISFVLFNFCWRRCQVGRATGNFMPFVKPRGIRGMRNTRLADAKHSPARAPPQHWIYLLIIHGKLRI